jgi:hypothetical protein
MAQNLEPRPVRVVHQQQRDAVDCRKIADADILAVAAKIGKAERPVIQHPEESRRPAAMLDIGPAGLAGARHLSRDCLFDQRSMFRSVFKVVTAVWMARSRASGSMKVWWAR